MAFGGNDKYRVAKWLNLQLLSSAAMQQNSAAHSEYRLYNAKLSPTEYQMNQPVPLLFDPTEIQTRMNAIALESSYLVDEIVQILDDLDENDVLIKTASISQKGALKKADTLEWDTSISKTQGVESRQFDMIFRLRYFLKYPPIAPAVSSGYLERC